MTTEPKERPLLYSPPMIRSVLADIKWMTRRLVTAKTNCGTPFNQTPDAWEWTGSGFKSRLGNVEHPVVCPYGVPGDRVWCKEGWRPIPKIGFESGGHHRDVTVRYMADGAERTFFSVPADWKVPKAAAKGNVTCLFMPRWASRITQEIEAVRVERLWAITEEDAKAEGVDPASGPNEESLECSNCPWKGDEEVAIRVDDPEDDWWYACPRCNEVCAHFPMDELGARGAFAVLWDTINPDKPWASNPLVWVLTFKREGKSMGAKTDIAWSDSTWSPLRARIKPDALAIANAKGYQSLVQILTATKENGELRSPPGKVGHHCEHASHGCNLCYSDTWNGRCLPGGGTGLPFDRRSRDLVDMFLDEKILMWPLKWKTGRRIFVESQSDLFGEFVPDEMIDRVFATMLRCVQGHVFQLLTKRAGRMPEYMLNAMPRVAKLLEPELGAFPEGIVWPPRNVWLGVSVEDQQRADERIPLLLQTPAAVRWVSYEPALGPIDFDSESKSGLHALGCGARGSDHQSGTCRGPHCRQRSADTSETH